MIQWNIAIIRFILMPLASLGLGAFFYYRYVRRNWDFPPSWRGFFERRLGEVIGWTSLGFLALCLALCSLRYLSFHSTFYDLGSYENKIWQIARTFPSLQSFRLCLTGHFQPILILYSVLYKVFPTPILLLFLQALTVTSGVIPLYKLAKDKLQQPMGVYIIVLIYFLYPAVLFNIFFDFHPDHFYIPCALWAYYFAHRRRYPLAVLMIAIGSLAKEPFLLGAAFFGLYLIVQHKKFWLGGLTLGFFILAFGLIYLYVQPLRYLYDGENSYRYLSAFFRSPPDFWHGLIQNMGQKALFIHLLMFPFLYLPFLRWKELLPAVPLAVVQLLSTSWNRYNTESQYTAGFVPIVIIAFMAYLQDSSVRKSRTRATAVLGMSFIVMVFLSAAKGPLPLSVNFWSQRWSRAWNYTNYVQGPHERVLDEALRRIPRDERVVVATQNNVNHSHLAQRWHYVSFPNELGVADYVLLDTTKPLFVYDYVDAQRHEQFLLQLERNLDYRMVFSRDGVMVFERTRPK